MIQAVFVVACTIHKARHTHHNLFIFERILIDLCVKSVCVSFFLNQTYPLCAPPRISNMDMELNLRTLLQEI